MQQLQRQRRLRDGDDSNEERRFMEATGASVHYAQTPFFNAALLANVPAAKELVLTPEVFSKNATMSEQLRQKLDKASREFVWRKLVRADAILHGGDADTDTDAAIRYVLLENDKKHGREEGARRTALAFALWRGSRGAARRVRESYAGLCVNHGDWFNAAWKTFRAVFTLQPPPSPPPSPAVLELFAMAVLFANGTPPRHLVFGALAVRGADVQLFATLVHTVLIATGLLAGSFRPNVGRKFPGVVHKEQLLPPASFRTHPGDEDADTDESVSRYVFGIMVAHLETTLAIYDGDTHERDSARWIRWAPVVYRTIGQFLAIYRGQIALLVCGHTSADEPVFLGAARDLASSGILGVLFGARPPPSVLPASTKGAHHVTETEGVERHS